MDILFYMGVNAFTNKKSNYSSKVCCNVFLWVELLNFFLQYYAIQNFAIESLTSCVYSVWDVTLKCLQSHITNPYFTPRLNSRSLSQNTHTHTSQHHKFSRIIYLWSLFCEYKDVTKNDTWLYTVFEKK